MMHRRLFPVLLATVTGVGLAALATGPEACAETGACSRNSDCAAACVYPRLVGEVGDACGLCPSGSFCTAAGGPAIESLPFKRCE